MDMPGGSYMNTNTNVLVQLFMQLDETLKSFLCFVFYLLSSASQYWLSQPNLFSKNSNFHTIISFHKRAFWLSQGVGHNVQHSAQLK